MAAAALVGGGAGKHTHLHRPSLRICSRKDALVPRRLPKAQKSAQKVPSPTPTFSPFFLFFCCEPKRFCMMPLQTAAIDAVAARKAGGAAVRIRSSKPAPSGKKIRVLFMHGLESGPGRHQSSSAAASAQFLPLPAQEARRLPSLSKILW